MTRITLLLLFVASNCWTMFSPVAAEDFCVETAVELQAALWQAQINAQNNHIKIVKGVYQTADNGSLGLGFQYDNSMPASLTITGGWTTGCGLFRGRSSAFETVLDGGNLDRVLSINAGNDNVAIALRNLTIQSGFPYESDAVVGGLLIKGFGEQDQAGNVLIDRVVFTGNTAYSVSALAVESFGRVDISNSLFYNNTVALFYTAGVSRNSNSSDGTYFVNNTVVDNTALSDETYANAAIVLQISDSGGAVAANNVMWNNTSLDLAFMGSSTNSHLLYNTVQNVIGNIGTNVGNITVDPMLAGNYTLMQNSPVLDAGFEPPTGPLNPPLELDWELGDTDIVGFPRHTGAAVDMGAFEAYDWLFNDRFE